MAKLTLFSKVDPNHDPDSASLTGVRSWWSSVGIGLACGALLMSGSAEAAEREPYWVFFVDKGVSPDQMPRALEERTGHLTQRALIRRQLRGKVLRNEGDLPIAQRYENAVLATGADLRTRSRWLNAISVDATATELEQIQDLSAVIKIQPVGRGKRNEPPLGPADDYSSFDQGVWAVDYGMTEAQLTTMGVPTAHECGLMGEGIIVGVLDSGFRTELDVFAELDVIGTWDFINDNEGVDNESSDGDASNQNSHGTNCLSLVAGWDPGNYVGPAPRVQVLLAKTENVPVEEMVEEDYYVAGLEWVEENGADISTSSLGYIDWYDPGAGGDLDGMTAVTTVAVNAAVARGLIALTAAGNNGSASYTMVAPADSPAVLTIGATNVAGSSIANFSSRGPTSDGRTKPNIVTPGQSVYVANTGGSYNTGSGTSFATPLAAGSVALILQAYPDTTPEEMMALLHDTASQSGSPDNTWGYGLIDVAEIVADYCSCTDADGDSYNDSSCGGNDCDDANPDVNPGADEICDDGIDNDCDGQVDDADEDCGGGDSESGGEDTGGESEGSESVGDDESDGEESGGEDSGESDAGESDEGEESEGDESDEGDGEDTGGEDTGGEDDSGDTDGGDEGTDDGGTGDPDDGSTGDDGPGGDSVGGDDMADAGADQGGADAGGQVGDTGGCTCSAQPSGWSGFSGLLLLLALGRRRRSILPSA